MPEIGHPVLDHCRCYTRHTIHSFIVQMRSIRGKQSGGGMSRGFTQEVRDFVQRDLILVLVLRRKLLILLRMFLNLTFMTMADGECNHQSKGG